MNELGEIEKEIEEFFVKQRITNNCIEEKMQFLEEKMQNLGDKIKFLEDEKGKLEED